MSIEAVGITVHRKWVRAHKNGYVPDVQRHTLLEALSDARRGMTRAQRRELLINTIIRERMKQDDIRILD